jgi:hypothetical protein
MGICANFGLTFFKCPTIANTYPLAGIAEIQKTNFLTGLITQKI